MPAGRPTVITDEVRAKLEEAFAWGCTDIEACLWAGIAVQTLYKFQEREPAFLERKHELKETPILLARKVVVDAVQSGDKDMAKWLLPRKKREEFSERFEADITSGGEKLEGALSAERLDQLIRARASRADI